MYLRYNQLGTGSSQNSLQIGGLGHSPIFTVGGNGYIGILSSTPQYNLDLVGTGSFTNNVLCSSTIQSAPNVGLWNLSAATQSVPNASAQPVVFNTTAS